MYRVLLLLLQHLLTLVFAIEVTPNSGCSSVCMNNPRSNPASVNSSQTRPTDIVCNDWELSGQNSTPIGRVFHDCVQCEENSTAFDKHSNENDVFWFLFNVKYSIVFCVFNFQNPNSSTQSEQCGEVCRGPSDTMELALVDKILVGNFDLRYHYCDDHNGSFTENLDSCMDCLEHVPASNALVNYLRVLHVACQQRPPIGGNTSVYIPFDLYSTTSPLFATSTSSATVTVTATPLASTRSNAAMAGIGFGVGLGLGLPFLAIAAALLLQKITKTDGQALTAQKHNDREDTQTDGQPSGAHSVESHHDGIIHGDSLIRNQYFYPEAPGKRAELHI